jgi:hypothetical protein
MLVELPDRFGKPLPVTATTSANTRSAFCSASARSIAMPSLSTI